MYIASENIPLPSIYYAHKRKVFKRDGVLYADTEFINKRPDEQIEEKTVRFRTIGDASCTGAVESEASTIEDVIAEISTTRITERGATRADDRRAETAMEDRKKQGYF
jgi:sulfate adenylyltransferase subunit 2